MYVITRSMALGVRAWSTVHNKLEVQKEYCPGTDKRRNFNFPGSIVEIFRFLISEISYFSKICSGNMLVRYRGIHNKGVLDGQYGRF